MQGYYAMDGLRRIMQDGCDAIDCKECPFFTEDNDRDCANFIAKCIIEADWSGFVMQDDGMVELEYAEVQDAD